MARTSPTLPSKLINATRVTTRMYPSPLTQSFACLDHLMDITWYQASLQKNDRSRAHIAAQHRSGILPNNMTGIRESRHGVASA